MTQHSRRVEDRRAAEQQLIENIAAARNELTSLLDEVNGHWSYEDGVYRFYDQSFKVFFLQSVTEKIVATLQGLLPEHELNAWFSAIVAEGTEKRFEMEMNRNWLQETRPIIEAFFHAKFFLEMICRYADEVKEPPQILPSGWAGVLCLYGLR